MFVELSDEQAEALKAKAASEGLSLEAWLGKLAAIEPAAERRLESAAEIVLARMRKVPPEVIAAMPRTAQASTITTSTAGLKQRHDDAFRRHVLLGCVGGFWRQRPPAGLDSHAERASSRIVTTDEVLAEYLTFFAAAPDLVRREVADSVEGILASSAFKAGNLFFVGCGSIVPVPIKAAA